MASTVGYASATTITHARLISASQLLSVANRQQLRADRHFVVISDDYWMSHRSSIHNFYELLLTMGRNSVKPAMIDGEGRGLGTLALGCEPPAVFVGHLIQAIAAYPGA